MVQKRRKSIEPRSAIARSDFRVVIDVSMKMINKGDRNLAFRAELTRDRNYVSSHQRSRVASLGGNIPSSYEMLKRLKYRGL